MVKTVIKTLKTFSKPLEILTKKNVENAEQNVEHKQNVENVEQNCQNVDIVEQNELEMSLENLIVKTNNCSKSWKLISADIDGLIRIKKVAGFT